MRGVMYEVTNILVYDVTKYSDPQNILTHEVTKCEQSLESQCSSGVAVSSGAALGCSVLGNVLVPATQCSAHAAIQAAAHVHEIMFSPPDPIQFRFTRVF